ncbi:MAG TPA: response regulator transcription factor [Amycolatopsis sp.]|nr:response regulator transcription factor [Amycolatopsis sp.]
MTKVLAVEDEADIVLALRMVFERAGYDFVASADGRSGLRAVHEHRPDVIVLDIGLPEMSGWTVLERVRDLADVPVLLLSAHGQESDKVRGLRAGADDYLTKPFANNELLARVEALLRRTGWDRRAPGWDDPFDDGQVRIDPGARRVEVSVAGEHREVCLTNIEFRLLHTLTRHTGAVLSAGQLLAQVWDDPTGVGPERVKFAVLRLRRKLGWAEQQSPIRAVRGVGYRYVRVR